MSEKLSLGGREFERVRGASSVAHDLYVMHHARHAGLGRIGEIREGETPEAYAQRILDTLISSGRAMLILGAMLLPAGASMAKWTEAGDPMNPLDNAMARESAMTFERITDPREKGILYSELAATVLDFFESGLGPWIASAMSSLQREDATETTTATSPDLGDTGATSFAPSPDTITK